jgi:hypothetical protein
MCEVYEHVLRSSIRHEIRYAISPEGCHTRKASMQLTLVDHVIQIKSTAMRSVGTINITHGMGLPWFQLRSLLNHSSVCRCSYSRQFCWHCEV